jgi:methyl-accepting chemotaxis protein
MDAMRGTMIQATRQIKKLSDSSLAMNGTVGLVLQFAGDLELLADNAQIEAARHEAGGVFTAVAEQTGRLAEDAQKALTDIQAAVLTNRQETAEVGRQMEQVATEVVAGVRAVEEARTAFEDITRSVRELDGFVERVNTVASGQVQVATAVSTAMAQIMTFFAQIADGVRLSEQDATQLRLTIDHLRNSIANLKLAADEPAADHMADRLRDRAVA